MCIRDRARGWRDRVRRYPVLIFGAGGAARAIAYGLLKAGSCDVRIVNRNLSRAQKLCKYLKDRSVTAFAQQDLDSAAQDVGLMVNASSCGMVGFPPLDVDLTKLNCHKQVFICDIVYNPLQTSFLTQGQSCGFPNVDGLGMLIHQARAAFAAWFGVRPEASVALRHQLVNNSTSC